VDGYYSAAEKNALIAACDCYVSLHRSEGWGLTMAEAMALAKPVIATGYSGNLDFMTTENSFLVDYVTGAVPAGCEPYTAGTRWAEPSLDSAAALMRRVFEQPEEAAARGRLARADILSRHSLDACAARVTRRVGAIHASMKNSVTARRNAVTTTPPEDGSVEKLLDSAAAMLTPKSGLPPTARLRGLRLLLQRGLLRTLRSYWWQQRDLQSVILEILRRRARVELEMQTDAADLRARVTLLNVRTRQMQSTLDRLTGLEAKVGAFQSGAAEQLRELEKRVGDAAHETHILSDRLYARPYVSDPERYAQTDEAGRPALGFETPVNDARSVYDGFEDIFRGSEQLIRARAQVYVRLLRNKPPVLDVGCGRGELLEALRDAGIPARGVDLDEAMVTRCRAKGLEVIRADALEFLATQVEDNSLGAVVAVQVIEHLTYSNLIEFLRLTRRRLAPGGVLIAETVNPHSIEGFRTFWTDLTHQAPIFPEVALAMSDLQGFTRGRIVFPFGSGELEKDRRTCGEYALIATK
jgi:2-polyprenyl-3-methyl-5-hydroxy-6-metoxy-1,4-benzoquinol methylase